MPPVGILSASAWDVIVAKVQGYANPLNAATLGALDEAAENIVGEQFWVNNAFHGHVTYNAVINGQMGAHIQYIEKPCNQKAKDSAPKSSPPGPSETGSYGGDAGYTYFGTTIVRTSNNQCLYGCDEGKVTVGDLYEQ